MAKVGRIGVMVIKEGWGCRWVDLGWMVLMESWGLDGLTWGLTWGLSLGLHEKWCNR